MAARPDRAGLGGLAHDGHCGGGRVSHLIGSSQTRAVSPSPTSHHCLTRPSYASLLRLEAGPAADGCEFLTRRSKDLLLLTRLTPNCNDLERRVIASRRRAFRRARTRAHLQRRTPALVRDADQRGPGHGGRRIARPESVDRGWRQTLQRLIATPGVRQQTQRGSAEPVGQAWRAQVEDRELPLLRLLKSGVGGR